MPETTSTATSASAQPVSASDDSVVVRGPDQRTYKFPKGTDKAAAITYFKKKGISGPQQTTPQATQAKTPQDSYKRGFLPQLGANLKSFLSPSGQAPYPGVGMEQKTEAAQQSHENDLRRQQEGYSRLYRAIAPVGESIGINASGAETSAKHGDVGGVLGNVLAGPTAMVASKIGAVAVDKVTGLVKPEALRQRAAELNTRVLKQADAGARDYKTSAGLQVAQEHIVSNARELPGKIEQIRAAKNARVEASAKAADAAGITIDISQDIKPIVQEVAQVSNARGQWTSQLRNQVSSLLQRVTMQTDFRTGQQVSRNLNKLTVTQALELEKGLKDLSAFGKEAPDAINNLARRLRGALNDKLPPDISKLRAEESRLITARDAARENYVKILNDKTSIGRGIIYGSGGTIVAYLGLKALGAAPMAAIGSVVVLRALAASTPSRTFRAALYARAASLLDSASGATMPRSAPSGPVQPGSAMQGPIGPKGPQPTANRALTGASAPPFASASVVQQNAQPTVATQDTGPQRGTQLPEHATRARSGSGDYVRGQEPKDLKTSVAVRNTSPAKSKAMLDRLDTLYERQAKPKSGADRNAIEREITEIKGILQGENLGTKHAGAPKRIADRERLAAKRSEAQATAPQVGVSASGEMVSQTASPEMRAIALDAGYKALLKYEGGTEMVKALRSTAKAMQRIDPSYDEVEKLTEALEVLKQVSGDLDTGKQ